MRAEHEDAQRGARERLQPRAHAQVVVAKQQLVERINIQQPRHARQLRDQLLAAVHRRLALDRREHALRRGAAHVRRALGREAERQLGPRAAERQRGAHARQLRKSGGVRARRLALKGGRLERRVPSQGRERAVERAQQEQAAAPCRHLLRPRAAQHLPPSRRRPFGARSLALGRCRLTRLSARASRRGDEVRVGLSEHGEQLCLADALAQRQPRRALHPVLLLAHVAPHDCDVRRVRRAHAREHKHAKQRAVHGGGVVRPRALEDGLCERVSAKVEHQQREQLVHRAHRLCDAERARPAWPELLRVPRGGRRRGHRRGGAGASAGLFAHA